MICSHGVDVIAREADDGDGGLAVGVRGNEGDRQLMPGAGVGDDAANLKPIGDRLAINAR